MVQLIVTRRGGPVQLYGESYGSVGISTALHYDETAFSCRITAEPVDHPAERDIRIDPQSGREYVVPSCGSDEMRIRFDLTPQRRGIFRIRRIRDFRREEQQRKTFLIIVL